MSTRLWCRRRSLRLIVHIHHVSPIRRLRLFRAKMTIQGRLPILCHGCSAMRGLRLRGLFLLELFVGHGFGDDVGEELEVFDAGYCVGYAVTSVPTILRSHVAWLELTNIAILNVPPRFLCVLGPDLVERVLDEMA